MTATAIDPQHAPDLRIGLLPAGFQARVHDITALAAKINAAGFTTGEATTRAASLASAVAGLAEQTPVEAVLAACDDLTTLSEEESRALVWRAAVARALASTQALNHAQTAYESRLSADLAKAFRLEADAVIIQMRKPFDAALAAVRHAHKAGLTATTTRDEILDSGSPNLIEAYRNLIPAADVLDSLASLRVEMCNVANIGPAGKAIACLFDPASKPDLTGAASAYVGNLGHVLEDSGHPGAGPVARLRATPRLGGRWLDLIARGLKPRLNTAHEADELAAA